MLIYSNSDCTGVAAISEAAVPVKVATNTTDDVEVCSGTNCAGYRGFQNYTQSGLPC